MAATLEAGTRRALDLFGRARVGLPLEYVGGVLAGAFQEPDVIGPAIGLPAGGRIPMDLLPRFGGSEPASHGADCGALICRDQGGLSAVPAPRTGSSEHG